MGNVFLAGGWGLFRRAGRYIKSLPTRILAIDGFVGGTLSSVVISIVSSVWFNKETVQVQLRENGVLLSENAIEGSQLNLQVDDRLYDGLTTGSMIEFKDVSLNKFSKERIRFVLGNASGFSLIDSTPIKGESSAYVLKVVRKKAGMRIFALYDGENLHQRELNELRLNVNVADGNKSRFMVDDIRIGYFYFNRVPRVDLDGKPNVMTFDLNSESYEINDNRTWNSTDTVVEINLSRRGRHNGPTHEDLRMPQGQDSYKRMTFHVVDQNNKPLANIVIRTTELGEFRTDSRGTAKVPFETSKAFKSIGFMFLDPASQYMLFSDSYRLVDSPDIIVPLNVKTP